MTCSICMRDVFAATTVSGRSLALEAREGGNVAVDTLGVARLASTGLGTHVAHRHRGNVGCAPCGGKFESVSFGIAVEKFRAHRCAT